MAYLLNITRTPIRTAWRSNRMECSRMACNRTACSKTACSKEVFRHKASQGGKKKKKGLIFSSLLYRYPNVLYDFYSSRLIFARFNSLLRPQFLPIFLLFSAKMSLGAMDGYGWFGFSSLTVWICAKAGQGLYIISHPLCSSC